MTSGIGNKRGLSLVEILISVAILASAAVLIMQGLLRGAYVLTLAEQRAHAYLFSVDMLANLEIASDVSEEATEGYVKKGSDTFVWHVEVSPLPEDEQLELHTLTVGWGQGRNQRSVRASVLRRVPPPEKPS